jgi:hypothetical protein
MCFEATRSAASGRLRIRKGENVMIEPIGVLLYGDNDDDIAVIVGDEHDDIQFRFIMLVGGRTGETLKFQPSDQMTVGEFFESMDEAPGNPSEDAILQLLKREENAAVLVAFDGEPRTFDLDEIG